MRVTWRGAFRLDLLTNIKPDDPDQGYCYNNKIMELHFHRAGTSVPPLTSPALGKVELVVGGCASWPLARVAHIFEFEIQRRTSPLSKVMGGRPYGGSQGWDPGPPWPFFFLDITAALSWVTQYPSFRAIRNVPLLSDGPHIGGGGHHVPNTTSLLVLNSNPLHLQRNPTSWTPS